MKKYVIASKVIAKDGTFAFAFYSGIREGKFVFTFDLTKAVLYASKKDALHAGVANAKILKVNI